MPLGSSRSKFNYNLDEKRVLNMENVVNDQDNIKQDMSIDVYGRKDDSDNEQEDEPATAAVSAPLRQCICTTDCQLIQRPTVQHQS